MYAFTSHLSNEEVHSLPGQYVGGVAIGIILFGQAGYALPPGSVENATTFNYPVFYQAISAASVQSVVSDKLDPEVLRQLVETGSHMEKQGCRAIIGACGYFANYLPEVKKALNVPCFFSSLMQVPLILSAMKPGKKVGIICFDSRVLHSAPVLRNCGINDADTIAIRGAEVLPEARKIEQGVGHYNPYLLEKGLIELADDLVQKEPDVGAILLECTLFPTHARAVQQQVKMPVYDFSTLIDWVYSGIVRRSFPGYI